MIAENKTESILGVHSASGHVLTLMPGGNQINEDVFNSMKKELEFLESKKKIAIWKTKAEFDAKGRAKPQGLANSLRDLNAEAAEKLASETSDLKTLLFWKESETRDSVRLALQKRIDEING
jgi:hypothetical protein